MLRLLHLADLHLGKSLGGFSLLEEQGLLLAQVLQQIEAHGVHVLLLAGDIYDRSLPPLEAEQLFDDFLTAVHACGCETVVIPGNHDSPERLGFASRLLRLNGLQLVTSFEPEPRPLSFRLAGEILQVWALPFISRQRLRQLLPEAERGDFAMNLKRYLAGRQPAEGPSLCLAHQLLLPEVEQVDAGTASSEQSLDTQVGSLDLLPLEAFSGFDQLCLGHIHRPLDLAAWAAYVGAPYLFRRQDLSFPERSTRLLELRGERWQVSRLPLVLPRCPMIRRGPLEALLDQAETDPAREHYVFVDLEDREIPWAAARRLRAFYPRLCQLRFVTEAESRASEAALPEVLSEPGAERGVYEQFVDFYESLRGQLLSPEARALLDDLSRLEEKV